MNRHAFLLLIFSLIVGKLFAASSDISLDKFPVSRVNNNAALQNGAKLYFNYCLGCHGVSQVRYSRLKDLGLTDSQIKENFFQNSSLASSAATIVSPMSAKDAKSWLGKAPPDLSLTARSRSSHDGSGADWIYTYLRSYYIDPSQRTGWNNLVYPGVGMPNVLWELQGNNKVTFTEETVNGNKTGKKLVSLEINEPGRMTKAEFDENMADLTAFLVWASDPTGQFRKQLGVWVLLFLGIFVFVAWRLNAAYWKDIK
jgi:ubiquinol-cytochrome c reductase cytochrome c1 subunit